MPLPTKHRRLQAWVDEIAKLTEPDQIVWCDGSQAEYDRLFEQMLATGAAERLDPDRRPNSYLVQSDPADVARVEDRTFICCARPEDAGPTNNWRDPVEMRTTLRGLFRGSMRGRTLYVIPFSMGPIGSPIAHIGVQLSDSPYVAASMRIMTRMGARVLDALGEDGAFVPCLHSVGHPLAPGQRDVRWPCNSENKYIVHFPETREIWSYGSGYGGNALLGKKCFALRIASAMARDEGWLAEHMLILKLTSPAGDSKYIAAAFPSACGKTNLAMMDPTLDGWKIETVGDDICWMKFGADGRLYAINPEAGFFGVAPGTSVKSNPHAMESLRENCIFTNVARTDDGDVWWEDMSEKPAHLIDWQGRDWTPASKTPAAHPERALHRAGPPVSRDRRRVAGSAGRSDQRDPVRRPPRHRRAPRPRGPQLGPRHLPRLDHLEREDRRRERHRRRAAPRSDGHAALLRIQHGRLLGPLAQRSASAPAPSSRASSTSTGSARAPSGEFLWPGYGENSRVLKWIHERCAEKIRGRETAIGILPADGELDLSGLCVDKAALETLTRVDVDGWLSEIPKIRAFYAEFGDRVPKALLAELDELEARLRAS